ncbi:MAG: tRNA (adenosine(37)-N6)-threonylcarbamoyltransferase complex dimerization subunit type 1 TsaB [Beijerinckiaceae bacterium]
MLILAIDTALGAVAACIYDRSENRVLASERLFIDRGHAEAVIPLIERMSTRTQGELSAVARVAVTIGPGSFTGIRVGVAAAKAIGTGLGVDVVGVSTLSAFAAPLLGRQGLNVGCVIDARHGNVYFECFDPNGSVVHEAAILPVKEAAARLGDTPSLLTGPGAALVAIEAWSQGKKVEVAGESASPAIEFVAKLGAMAEIAESPAQPFYLKPADVTPKPLNLVQAKP